LIYLPDGSGNSQVSYLPEGIYHTSFSSNKEIKHCRNNEKKIVFKTSFFASRSDVLRLIKEDTVVLGTINVICMTKKGYQNLMMFVQNHICYFYEREESRTKHCLKIKNSLRYLLKRYVLKDMSCQLVFLDLIRLLSSINFNNFFCGCHLIHDTDGFSNNLDNFLLKREYNMGPEKLQVFHLFYNVLDDRAILSTL
jgi:hypothetical protein